MLEKQLGGISSFSSWMEAGQSKFGLNFCFQALDGFVIAVTGDGYIFYISPTVQDYLGFHQVSTVFSWLETDGCSPAVGRRCRWRAKLPKGHQLLWQGKELEFACSSHSILHF